MTWPGPVTIPVRQMTTGFLNDLPRVAQIIYATSPATLVLEAPLALAVGPDYPSVFTARLRETTLTNCAGAGLVQGTVTLKDVSGSTPAVSATVMNDATVSLSVTDAGTVTLVAKGEIDITSAPTCLPADAHPFELRLTVTAFRPTGAAFTVPSSCASAGVKLVAGGSRMKDGDLPDDDGTVFTAVVPMLRAEPLDALGQPITVANADPLAQIAVAIHGPPGSAGQPMDVSWTIASLVFPEAAGPVTFTPSVGDPLTVEVVRAEQVERLDLEVQLAGFAGGPLNLADQAAYGFADWHRRRNVVEPRAFGTYVGAGALCSPPASSWFTFESATPSICTTMPAKQSDATVQLDGMSIGQSGRFVADGICTLSVRAPRLFGGKGFARTLTFTLSEVARLSQP